MSEETTKGLVKRTLSASGYPQNQDVEENGITIYKEESYNDFAQNDEMAKFLKSQFRVTMDKLVFISSYVTMYMKKIGTVQW